MIETINRIRRTKKGSPFHPITIVCGPSARTDVVIALSEQGPVHGVTVLNASMFLKSLYPGFSPRKYLTKNLIRNFVAKELVTTHTRFHAEGLDQEPATLRGVTNIVERLLALSPQQVALHRDATLPKACAEIAEKIREASSKEYFTEYEVRQRAREVVNAGDVLTVGVLSEDPALTEIFGNATQCSLGEFESHQRISSYADEEEEVYDVARQIIRAVSEGTPLHRIAVAYADSDYHNRAVRILQETGIEVSAQNTQSSANNPSVSAFLRLIKLDADQMPRRDIANLLSTRGLKGNPPLERFDLATRGKMAINAGLDWDRYAEDDDEARREVAQWVLGLREDLKNLWGSTTANELSERLRGIVDKHLRRDASLGTVIGAIDDLALLLALPSQDNLFDLLTEALGRPEQEPHKGLVTLGPLETLVGRDLDHAFILGVTDDAVPGSFQPDAAVTPEQSGWTSENFSRYRKELWEAVTHCARWVWISFARTSLTGALRHNPSQWLGLNSEALGIHLSGKLREIPAQIELCAKIGESHGEPAKPIPLCCLHQGMTSMLTGLAPEPVTANDVELVRAFGGEVPEEIQRYAEIMNSRLGGNFNKYNGKIDSEIGERFLEKVTSASALEAFVKSPQFFFIDRVLGMKVLEDPELGLKIDARESGSGYHDIFDRWTKEVFLEADPRPQGYAEVDWEEAEKKLQGHLDGFISRLKGGGYPEIAVQLLSNEARRATQAWFEQQKADVAEGWIPMGSELAFGDFGHNKESEGETAPPLEVTLENAVIKIRGSIDRVDVRKGGDGITHIRVTDFKSGKAGTYQEVKEENPLGIKQSKDGLLGPHLQLALYGEAVREILNRHQAELFSTDDWGPISKNVELTARYWLFKEESKDKSVIEIRITDEVHDAFVSTLRLIYEHIAGGHFPAHKINERWNSNERDRLGGPLYNAIAQALIDRGTAPLDIGQGAV